MALIQWLSEAGVQHAQCGFDSCRQYHRAAVVPAAAHGSAHQLHSSDEAGGKLRLQAQIIVCTRHVPSMKLLGLATQCGYKAVVLALK